jgi:hypothetical protein
VVDSNWLCSALFYHASSLSSHYLATGHWSLSVFTRHSPPAMPDSRFGDPEWGPLCMRDMLQFATFSGFFAIDKNSIFGINPHFGESYVKYTNKHAF